MTIITTEAHSRAVLSIQALLSKHTPGSFPYQIAERALDLAFNSARALGGDREQELLTEAKYFIDRQVRAKLLVELSSHVPVVVSLPNLWLTNEERNGGSHACLR
jgi:hypothetical protein